MATEPNQTNRVETFKPDDGVILKGLIVSSEIKDREWEGQKYRELKATISNGKKSFFYVTTDKDAPLPKVEVMKRAFVEVEFAKFEKGVMTLRGNFHYDS